MSLTPLEAVGVQEQHGVLLGAGAARPGQRRVQPLAEQGAVGQAGQGIVRGLVAQLPGHGAQLGGARLHPVFEFVVELAQGVLGAPQLGDVHAVPDTQLQLAALTEHGGHGA